jgi:N-sulfoglucosamine sulfohydrolase
MYENSSRGALILRWPGVIEPGGEDTAHLVSTLDFTPTLLDASGVKPIPGIDGRSFLPAIRGRKMDGWDTVFTFYNKQGLSNWIPMRAIRTRDYAYIWNPWSDGTKTYRAENMAGLTWNALVEAGKTEPGIQQRVDHYLYRVPEEFYDLTVDPFERDNLISDAAWLDQIEQHRARLLEIMQRTGDPLAEAFARRGEPEVLASAMEQLANDYPKPGPHNKPDTTKTTKTAKSDENLIAFELPESLVAGKPAILKINHRLPEPMGVQTLVVTLKSGNRKIDRQAVEAEGEGVAEVSFDLPGELSGQSVTFAAFVGKSFPKTPQFIESRPQSVK